MRKTSIVVASVLAAVAVSPAMAAETKGEVTILKDKTSAEFKITPEQGKYMLTTSTAVKEIVVKQGETVIPLADGAFNLEAKEYTIIATVDAAAAEDTKITVWMYNTAIIAEAEEAVKKLTNDISVAINQADKAIANDKTLQDLSLVGSGYSKQVNDAAVEVGSTAEAWKKYTAYVDGTSYLKNANDNIKKLSDDVKAAKANYDQYQAALALYNKIKADATNGIAALQAAYDAANKEIQDANKIDALKAEVEKIKTDAEDAYKENKCASTFSKDALTTLENGLTGAKGSIPAKIAAINSGNDALAVYADVVSAINTARTSIATQKSELYGFLINGTDDKQIYAEGVKVNGENREIYEDTYAAQLLAIAKIERAINAVEAGNSKEPGKGYAAAADAKKEIDAAIAPLAEIISNCKTEVLALRKAYNDKCVVKNGVTANYGAITFDGCKDTETYYTGTMADLKKSTIEAIQAYLDAQNAAHDKEYTAYAGKVEAANKSIADVKTKVDNSKKEETAYNASKATIAEWQGKLDAAKKAVAAAKYECKVKGHEFTYTIGTKFDRTINDIQNEIKAISDANDKAYTVKTNGAWANGKAVTTSDHFNTAAGSQKDLTLKFYTETKHELNVNADVNKELSKAIDLLSSRATELVNKVGVMHTDIAANEIALAALTEKVGENGNVTSDGHVKSDDNKTYTDEIAALQASLDKEKAAYDNAMKLSDDAAADKNHYQQVMKLTAAATIATDANKLTTDFDTNKTKWEHANLDAACEKLLAEANRLIVDVEKIVGSEYDAATYGKRANEDWSEGEGKDKKDYKDLNEQRLILKGISDAAKTKVEGAAAPYTNENLALLKEVVDDLNTKVLGGFTELGKLAERVKTEYANETTLNKKLNEAADEVQNTINGNGTTKSIMAQATDKKGADYTSDLQKKVDNAQNDINAYKDRATGDGKIKTSFVAETLYKDEPGKDGYTAKIAAIQTTVKALVEEAKAITANYNAWKSVNTYLTTGTVAKTGKTYAANISKAKSDLATFYAKAGTSEEAKAIYDKLVQNEEVEKNAITDANEADYKKLTENKESDLKARVDASVARLNDIAKKAEANEKAYKGDNYLSDKNGQVFSYNEALKTWTELNDKVAAEAAVADSHYTSKDKKGWNDQLTSFRKAIENYYENTTAAYNEGNAADNAFKADLDAVKTAMSNFSASFDGEYAVAVAADNAERKERFDNAYKELTNTYSEQIQAVAELSRLGDFVDQFNDDLVDVTTEKNIYQYAGMIRDLQAKADGEFNKTIGTNNFYDEDEANKDQAIEYKDQVVKLAQKYINDVNGKALDEYTAAYTAAEKAYNDAIAKMAGWDKSVIDGGKPTNDDLQAVAKMLADYKNSADKYEDGSYKNLGFAAKWVNTIKADLASVADKVKAGLDASTAAQWNVEKNAYNTLNASEAAEIAQFNKLDGSEVVTGYYSNNYQNMVSAVNNNIANAEKNGFGYSNYSALHNALGQFASLVEVNKQQHTSLYKTAYDANQAWANNDVAYNEHMAVVDAFGPKLDEAAAFANVMLSRHSADVENAVAKAQRDIEDYKSKVESDHLTGNSKSRNKDTEWAKGWQNTINEKIATIYTAAINGEKAEIASTVADLQYDYDKASAFVLTSNLTGDEQDKLLADWKKAITAISDANENIYKDNTEGKLNDKKVRDPKNKANNAETQAAYLALEKTIGELKSQIKSYSDEADKAMATTYASELNDALDAILSTIDATKPVHQPVVDAYGEQLEEVKATYEAIMKLVADATADNTILLDYNNLKKDIDALSEKATPLKNAVVDQESQWEYSDIISSTITEQFENIQQYLDDVYEVANNYPSKNVGSYWINGVSYGNQLDFQKAQSSNDINSSLDEFNGITRMLNEDDATKYKNIIAKIQSDINEMWYNASVYSINQTLSDVNTLRSEVSSCITKYENELTDSDKKSFRKQVDDLNSARNNANNFKNYVTNSATYGDVNRVLGYSNYDIDGKYTGYETYAWVDINGDDVYSQIVAKANEITEALNDLKEEVEAARFTIGDVNGDHTVDINDYAQLANIILNQEESTLEGKAFNIADANADKEITVADLQAIINIIKTAYDKKPLHVKAYNNRLQAQDDELTLSVDGDVMSIGINNALAYTGFQMDITLPMGATIMDEELTARGNGQEISVSNIGGNTYRVLVMGTNGAAFKGNEGAIASLKLANMHGTAAISNTIFTDADAVSHRFDVAAGNATAINGVEAQQSATEMIYSVGGQIKSQVSKGINIIKSNGVVKKFIVGK